MRSAGLRAKNAANLQPTNQFRTNILVELQYDPWVLQRLTIESGFALYPLLIAVERGLF
jgi:hypothetical protein